MDNETIKTLETIEGIHEEARDKIYQILCEEKRSIQRLISRQKYNLNKMLEDQYKNEVK